MTEYPAIKMFKKLLNIGVEKGFIPIQTPEGEHFTDEEWKQITESIEEESCDVDLESLAQLWIDTQLDYIRKEGREIALECGYLVEKTDPK